MKLSKIQVNNYRQLDNVILSLQDDITILAGPNNSGKTTFISLVKGVLSDSKLRYNYHDIPVNKVKQWLDRFFPFCVKQFSTENKSDVIIDNIINEITCDGELKPEFSIDNCEIKIEISYNQKNDDIRNFSEYIMELDELNYSFYFLYTFTVNILSFKKLLIQYFEKIHNRIMSFNKDDSEQKASIIKDLLINIYSSSLEESCYFTDSKYENKCKMEITDFKKLFNFKSINAQRKLDDTDTDAAKTLSKSIVSLASKDSKWKDSTKSLPDNILANIQDSKVQETVRKASVETLSSTLKSLSQTNGGHVGEILLEMDVTEDDVSDFIKKITSAKYQLDGHFLSESSQGLGYSNLIYLHMQLEEFKTGMNPFLVNVFFIEEPEAHMHPQMQNVFIKYLLSVYNQIGLQGLVTTHSNEMVRVAGLKNLRVIREIQLFKSEIFDLADFSKNIVYDQEDESEDISLLENFFDWFFEIGFAEIIFSDKVILYEGDTERLYIRKLITLPEYKKLSEQYIAFIQVGGAYAYNYKQLIEFLKIKTLIITDLDYSKSALTENDVLASNSTNSTIKKFYKISKESEAEVNYKGDEDSEESPTVEEIYKWKENGKISNDLIYVAFQEKDYYARTLEEAMLSKFLSMKSYDKKKRSEWKNIKSDNKLKFTLPNNRSGEEDSQFSVRDIVSNMSNTKTDFMYSVILNKLGERMMPKYIGEGLKWLMEK